jgi:hypothetical protein
MIYVLFEAYYRRKIMTEKKNQSTNIKKTEENTEANIIWNEIKDKAIEMFALPEQKISQYAAPVSVEPSKLYLLTRASSVLPAIEAAVGKNYTVELVDKYTVVARTIVSLTRK